MFNRESPSLSSIRFAAMLALCAISMGAASCGDGNSEPVDTGTTDSAGPADTVVGRDTFIGETVDAEVDPDAAIREDQGTAGDTGSIPEGVSDSVEEVASDSGEQKDEGQQDLQADTSTPPDDGGEPLPQLLMVEFLSEDFENMGVGPLPQPWLWAANGGSIGVEVAAGTGEGLKVLKLVDLDEPGVYPVAFREYQELADNLTDSPGFVSFDFHGTGENAHSRAIVGTMNLMMERDGTSGNGKLWTVGGFAATTCTNDLPMDEWVNIRVEIDWPGSQASVFVNNQPTECKEIDIKNDPSASFPKRFTFETLVGVMQGSTVSYTGGTFMIDNLVFARLQQTATFNHPVTGTTWQQFPPAQPMLFSEVESFCSWLVAPDGMAWRVPTISELRTLVDGCAATETDGACGVMDTCRMPRNCRGADCNGCTVGNGCKWLDGLGGGCPYPYLSSTLSSTLQGIPWYVRYRNAYINEGPGRGTIRCILD